MAEVAKTLDELRAAKEKRDAARATMLEGLELEALQLEEKYESEGKRLGVDFLIETTLVGNFVVSKPEFIVAKKFADAETKSVEDVIQFVSPCVIFPETTAARKAFLDHAGIAWRLTVLLMKLYEANAGKVRGK